jgi:tRNA pseudouridine38-40 synthase
MTAPSSGLELSEVRYPDKAFTDPDSIRWHREEEE